MRPFVFLDKFNRNNYSTKIEFNEKRPTRSSWSFLHKGYEKDIFVFCIKVSNSSNVNEIVRCTMKSSAFGFRWNQIRPSSAIRQISSQSDFIHHRWIYSAEGGFNWKHDWSKPVVFSGWGIGVFAWREDFSPRRLQASLTRSTAQMRTPRLRRYGSKQLFFCQRKEKRPSDDGLFFFPLAEE